MPAHDAATRPAPPLTKPSPPAGPPVKPAAIVFGIILALFLVGVIVDGISSSHGGSSGPRPSTADASVPGTGGLVAIGASPLLRPIVTPGQPPADVLAAVVVPRGTTAIAGSARQRGVGLYDASLDVQLPAAEAPAITFFRRELAAGHWRTLSSGATGDGGFQLLAQHPGSDGYQWELGLTMAPTSFTSAVAGVAAPAGGVTRTTIRLYALSDQS